ncbi:MAG TPA: YkvA family protein [Rugosimonospora sp.]|nr:YkvA family protein [Rugosimonospora sp.]
MARLGRKAALTALWQTLIASRHGPSLGKRLGAVPRMLKETFSGRYDGKGRLAAITVGLIYVISPIDLIPEAFLLALGLADDAVVAVWIAGAVLAETERFLKWENARAATINGQAVPH